VASLDLFLLDPAFVHLNHGSFGACPRPVFDVYQERQRELERRPVEFLARRLESELAGVRGAIGGFVGASPDDIALVPHATAALNGVVRSLRLEPGDEILTTEHEYGSMDLLLEFVCGRTGARVVRRAGTDADSIWGGATERTRALFVSHVTSPTAVIMPVEELCRRARGAGVPSVVDGAHGPGHVTLDLERLGADFYAGNCHKWLCAPKGAGFLYARPESQEMVDPLVISWTYTAEGTFAARHGWQGTHDPAAYLAVPAAIDFVRRHGRAEDCRTLLQEAAGELGSIGLEPVSREPTLQMAAFRLPDCDADEVQRRLREEFAIEVLVKPWRDQPLLRVSVAAYNTKEDLERLVAALGGLL
jgi:isopenicillin-N epimerase